MEDKGRSTLYGYLVHHCFKGSCQCEGPVHVCAAHRPKTTMETEGPRQLKIRTFLNTVIAISTPARGAANPARKDRSLPHKRVRFSDLQTNLPAEKEAVDVSPSPSTKNSDPITTESNTTNHLTPGIIETMIACDCPKHKHCLTCQFQQPRWKRSLKELHLAPSMSRKQDGLLP